MTNDTDTKTYVCPSCGKNDYLFVVCEAVGFSGIQPDGEFTGETEFDIVRNEAVKCEDCGWTAPIFEGYRDHLLVLKLVEPPAPPLKVTYWGGLDKDPRFVK